MLRHIQMRWLMLLWGAGFEVAYLMHVFVFLRLIVLRSIQEQSHFLLLVLNIGGHFPVHFFQF